MIFIKENLFLKDVIKAASFSDQWLFLGWHDIRSKYRRTILGPLWIILVNLITILCFTVIGGALFNQDIKGFLPHVAAGMFVWAFIGSILGESCNNFITNAHILQNLNINPTAIILRMVVRNIIIFLHSLVIIFLILLLLGHGLSMNMFYFFLAVPIYLVGAVAISVICGFLGTRYRDISFLVQSILTIFPFITPIMWKIEMLGNKQFIAYINPITHYIAIMREPLLGNKVHIIHYIISSSISIILLILANYLYNKFRHRLVFWL